MNHSLSIGLIASFVAACAPQAEPVFSAQAPGHLDAPGTNKFADAARACVRGYLQTFHLNEKSLARGLAIPCTYSGPSDTGFPIVSISVLQATGNTGPQGHQVYEFNCVNVGNDPGTISRPSPGHQFLEISAEPEGGAPPPLAARPPAP
jgi:hypothetical protein